MSGSFEPRFEPLQARLQLSGLRLYERDEERFAGPVG
jgi:hypothetical protein